jgi:hypothetical protein
MHKILVGLTFAAIMAKPALAQDYRKNFNECARELGLFFDSSYTHRVQPESGGHLLGRYILQNEAQMAAFNDCVARKASLASKPSGKGSPRASR